MAEIEALRRQYEGEWEPSKYLETYSGYQFQLESFFVPKLFEAIDSGKIKGSRGIDIGCGPTVHRMALLSKVCEEMIACDYTQSNLDLVKKWLNAEEPAGLYTDSLKLASQLEGHENAQEGEKSLCERLRSKLKHVVHCDLTKSDSVSNLLQYGGQFDFAHSNGCVEAACLTYESLVDILKRIGTLLKPGAVFVLSGYLNGDYYYVGGVRFVCLFWTKDTVQKGLKEAGFKVETIEFSEGKPDDMDDKSNCQTGFFSLSYKA